MTKMKTTSKRGRSPHVTGHEIRDWVKWLLENQEGCCHKRLRFGERNVLCVCVGWRKVDEADPDPKDPMKWIHREEWKVVAKLGFQSYDSAMQTDLDIDFMMPWNTRAFADRMNARLTPEERKRGDHYVAGDVYDTSMELCGEKGPVPSLTACAAAARYLNENIHGVFKTLLDMEKEGEA